ncbi:MFS transporter [Xinfangfangia sp. CPCC 101601]|uniref:MFS transporter n=1 Tax=Pseudogemmobacter lacusdianii TaxID=3069608 RepID=A0ABU0VY27_9RHOB|nr:MFS transporter [Xinfangfangia sp. CPCC 101601]MDQ2066418.1 MFS transporter [Xinfangfangia sp. CPCC 101601]
MRYLPLDLKHTPTPKIEHLALLAGLEAAVRGVMVSVWPIYLYHMLGSAQEVSVAYLIAGIISLVTGLMVPWLTAFVPRRWMYTLGCSMFLLGAAFAMLGSTTGAYLAIVVTTMGTATNFVCFNAYVLDYVARENLGRSQSVQMAYAAAPWALGPFLGPVIYTAFGDGVFLVSAGFAVALLATFWVLRLGNGKQIAKARGPAINPLGFLTRFVTQPRLIAGWFFAVMRSCGWWVYCVYLPIFCIEAGLGDKVGSSALGISNTVLFFSPMINRWARQKGVRRSVRLAFLACGVMMLGGALFAVLPWVTVVLLFGASVFLVTLDVVGGLPFLMSVKPSERTEMSAVYSSFRDVSGILTPGVAWLVLLVLPLPGIFAASGLGLFAAWAVAGRLHSRLGADRPSHGGQTAEERAALDRAA